MFDTNDLSGLKMEIKNLKWFFTIYLIFLLSFLSYQMRTTNFNIKLTSISLILLFILGSFILVFISKRNLPLYKIAFIVILIFGLCCVFITPIVTVCDETEHFWRSEITSEGQLFPNYVDIPNSNKSGYEAKGYETIASMSPLYKNTGNTIFNTNWDDLSINYTTTYVSSAFCQNPFYGYIPQAIGIDIAKGLNLNNIWMLWFGRIANLLMFAFVCSYAIKKAPIFKIPLFITATLPLTIYQAASLSIDATVNSFAILTIAYFLYMYKAGEKTLDYKNLIAFLVISLIGGFTKVTYMGLLLLIFLVPKDNFKDRKVEHSRIIGFIGVILIDLLWTKLYATKHLLNSWRGTYFIKNNVNILGQLTYMAHHPLNSLYLLFTPDNLINVISGYFSFGNLPPYTSTFLVVTFLIFYVILSFLYPQEIKLDRKSKIGVFFIGLLIFIGTYLIQYLTWCNVGMSRIEGVFGRYFIPLLVLGPMIFGLKKSNKNEKNSQLLVITMMIGFISSMILLTIMKFY
ncbi:MAG: DUF2142 domain-containing protein [Methanobrevibacter boviskoreani]|jgi:uncharacterized membrane protein|uniref:DUF2142 domain-containing protein n=1 Tax=Methanobrevibacter boviskoreani TaxID=1348249 RepID=UPI0023A8B479|nr:DUF2142 domain-containing protein [Methanobrevibacter boviskoreani]MCI6930511.1 DUF2142 domain-containing protein [Methanobrevibacter boviskoreani]MDD6257035.1 DUF2142 domain-containing protein [Methanobrevibacter boviskoreani]